MIEKFSDEMGRIYRVEFLDGEVFFLRDIYKVDPSIYGEDDRFSGILDNIENIAERRQKLFTLGSHIDFRMSDVRSAQNVGSGDAQPETRQ